MANPAMKAKIEKAAKAKGVPVSELRKSSLSSHTTYKLYTGSGAAPAPAPPAKPAPPPGSPGAYSGTYPSLDWGHGVPFWFFRPLPTFTETKDGKTVTINAGGLIGINIPVYPGGVDANGQCSFEDETANYYLCMPYFIDGMGQAPFKVLLAVKMPAGSRTYMINILEKNARDMKLTYRTTYKGTPTAVPLTRSTTSPGWFGMVTINVSPDAGKPYGTIYLEAAPAPPKHPTIDNILKFRGIVITEL
jgi:hypothetical protein